MADGFDDSSLTDGGDMSELSVKVEGDKSAAGQVSQKAKPNEKQAWETPKLEDVSEQVMAQPYIRFT